MPADHLRSDRVWYSFEPEEATLPWVVEMVGEERLVYASDYAHWNCTSPDSVRLVRDRTDLTDAVRRKLLSENAPRCSSSKASPKGPPGLAPAVPFRLGTPDLRPGTRLSYPTGPGRSSQRHSTCFSSPPSKRE